MTNQVNEKHSQLTFSDDYQKQIEQQHNHRTQKYQDKNYPYTSQLREFEFNMQADELSWATNMDQRFENAHTFLFRRIYTLRNTYFEKGRCSQLSLEESIEDLESRNKLCRIAIMSSTEFEEDIFDPFNNYQLIMDTVKKLHRLFSFDPGYPETAMTELGCILSLRSAVYGNPFLENLYKPFEPEADIFSVSLLSTHTTNAACLKLINRLLCLNRGNVYNEHVRVHEGWCFDEKNLMMLLLLPQGITKWIIPFFKSQMSSVDLQTLLNLKKKFTNLSIIQFACLSFISSLSDDSFDTILKNVERAKCTRHTQDEFRLVTLAEVISQTDDNIFFRKPELLQTVRRPNLKPFRNVFEQIFTEQEVIHDPELDIRGHFANTNTSKAGDFPLDWLPTPNKMENLSGEVSPGNKIRSSPLKRRLLRFFKLERSNRKALRQMKQLLRRQSYRNPAAEKLHGKFPPSAIERVVEAKHLTKRLVSTFLPFNNDLIPDDDGYISDTPLKAESTSSVSESEEVHKTDAEHDCGGDFETTTLTAGCSAFTHDCGGYFIRFSSRQLLILKHKFRKRQESIKKMKMWKHLDPSFSSAFQDVLNWLFEPTTNYKAVIFHSEYNQKQRLQCTMENVLKHINICQYTMVEITKEEAERLLQRAQAYAENNKAYECVGLKVVKIMIQSPNSS